MKIHLFSLALATSMALSTLAISSAPVEASPDTNLQAQRDTPRQGRLASPGGGSGNTAGYQHDSDRQLDIWVARCNKAGGGMELGNDGNYRCVGSDAQDIDNW